MAHLNQKCNSLVKAENSVFIMQEMYLHQTDTIKSEYRFIPVRQNYWHLIEGLE